MFQKIRVLSYSMSRKISCHYGPTNTYIVATPIGDMEVISCPKGLHSLSQMDDSDADFNPNMDVKIKVVSQIYQDNGYTYKPALQCVDWLTQYFHHKLTPMTKTPLMCKSITKEGTFTGDVWKTLPEKVVFGQTISYAGLADLCGNKKACRAVGMAMRNNPIQLMMPCHRVIQENGNAGNYSGGKKNKMKMWLLQHEGAFNT